jgi:hypothetical protein
MKCPKCSYISFDHNQVCPKCEKDITTEQAKLNLPLFLANPPFLLASLIGEMEEVQGDYDIGTQTDGIEGESSEFSFNDTTVLEGTSFDETQDLSMSLDDDESLKRDLDELPLEDPDSMAETGEGKGAMALEESEAAAEKETADASPFMGSPDEEITLDFEEPTVSEKKTELDGTQELAEGKELALDLGELTIDEADGTLEMGGVHEEEEKKETPLKKAEFTMDSEKETQGQGTGEIELSLDDLKIDDTGELLIGDDTVVIDSSEIAPELEKTKGDDSGSGDLKVKGENLARDLPDEAPTLESESISVDLGKDEELNIDLDDLDLELDLEEPEGKKK